MVQLSHKLRGLLPDKHSSIKKRETKANRNVMYNFSCRTERLKNSPLVYAIDKYNENIASRISFRLIRVHN